MFSDLFGKKEKTDPNQLFVDRAYMTHAAKMNACAILAGSEQQIIFIAWFRETAAKLNDFFKEKGIENASIVMAEDLGKTLPPDTTPVFVEHYPLHSIELKLTDNWNLKNIPVYSSLDEPLFRHFGSEILIPLMKMMGMKENAVIEHSMVSKSIFNGQQKIESVVKNVIPADSQESWMQQNMP